MRRTRTTLACLAAILALTAGPAVAEEIIYFTNGTSMPIVRHEVKGDMIHVDLGSEATMAFPMRQVDKIEQAGKEVNLRASSLPGNRIIKPSPPDPNGPRPVRGVEPGRFNKSREQIARERAAADPQIQMDGKMGTAVYRPYQHSRVRGKRALGATGNQRILLGDDSAAGGYTGAKRLGTRHVIGGKKPSNFPGGKKPPIVGLGQKPSSPSTTPARSNNSGNNNSSSSQGQSSSSGSGSGD